MHSFPTRRSYVLQEEEVPFEHYTSPIHRADSTARRGARSRSALAARLEQEPRALLGLIGPVVEDAAGRVVLGVVDDVLGLAQRLDQLEVVVAQLDQHVVGLHERSEEHTSELQSLMRI